MKLTQAQVDRFATDGYLLVRNALRDEDLNPIIVEYEHFIDLRAREMFAAGKISDLHAGESFERRLALICRECNEIFPELDIMKLRAKAAFAFLRNDRLLDMVESFVGPEITCSPIQHMRAKLPQGLATAAGHDAHVLPWHQDAGGAWEEADSAFILTVLLPLTRADMADYLGLTIETVSRQITRLKTAGTIQLLENRVFVVPDLAALVLASGADAAGLS